MNTLNNDNYYLIEQEDLTVLFVNSTEIPIKYIPLDCFKAEKIGNEYKLEKLLKLSVVDEYKITSIKVDKFVEFKSRRFIS